MKRDRRSRWTGVIACAAIALLPALVQAKPRWTQIIDEAGIQVYARDAPGTHMVEFMGRGIIEDRLPKVMSIMQDVRFMPRWIEGCTRATLVEKNYSERSFDRRLDEMYAVLHSVHELPWPLSDRDYVARVTVDYDAGRRATIVSLRNIRHPRVPPRTDAIRMPLMKTVVTLIPTHQDRWTWIEVYAHVDPGGWLPAWAVNRMAKKVPLKSIKKLRALAPKASYDRGMARLIQHYLDRLAPN